MSLSHRETCQARDGTSLGAYITILQHLTASSPQPNSVTRFWLSSPLRIPVSNSSTSTEYSFFRVFLEVFHSSIMLASSLRRAMRTTTSSHSASAAIVAFPNLLVPTTTSITTSSRATRRRGAAQQHQRRYSSSSSKPPVPPNDGSRPIDASSSQQAPANPSAGRKVKESQGRKAGAGAAGDVTKSRQSSAALLNLPSVPSTQDTPVEGLSPESKGKKKFSLTQILTPRFLILW